MTNIAAAFEWIMHALAPIAGVDVRWALLALVLQLANLACRAFTWRNVLAAAYPHERLSAWRVGLAYAVGAGLNGYLPARGGDAVKVALVKLQLPSTSAIAVASSCSVVIVFDTLVGGAVLGAGFLSGTLPGVPAAPALLRGLVASPALTLLAVLLVVGAVTLLVRRFGHRVRGAGTHILQGVAVLRSPGRYARTVVSMQSVAWACRIGVVFCLLSAFGIPATLPLAALVVVAGGMSTLVPVPGGAGTQQALAVFVLAGVTTTSTALAYSIGAQVGITIVNTSIAAVAAMLIFGRLHPVRALREAAAAAALRPAPEPAA